MHEYLYQRVLDASYALPAPGLGIAQQLKILALKCHGLPAAAAPSWHAETVKAA